jgi:hypothetical protein
MKLHRQRGAADEVRLNPVAAQTVFQATTGAHRAHHHSVR